MKVIQLTPSKPLRGEETPKRVFVVSDLIQIIGELKDSTIVCFAKNEPLYVKETASEIACYLDEDLQIVEADDRELEGYSISIQMGTRLAFHATLRELVAGAKLRNTTNLVLKFNPKTKALKFIGGKR